MQILELETQNYKANKKSKQTETALLTFVWIVLSSKQRLRIRKPEKPDDESCHVKLHLLLLHVQQPKHQIKRFKKPTNDLKQRM